MQHGRQTAGGRLHSLCVLPGGLLLEKGASSAYKERPEKSLFETDSLVFIAPAGEAAPREDIEAGYSP